jgi:GntR family transcriptional regulator
MSTVPVYYISSTHPAMRIEPTSTVPIFQQIADGIRAEVASGIYRPGDLIPSVRAQALALLVNPNTVQRAYEQLEREGLVASRKGVGMVVSDESAATARNGVDQGLRVTLSQAVSVAKTAGVSRSAVDRLYREAWNQNEKRSVADKRG